MSLLLADPQINTSQDEPKLHECHCQKTCSVGLSSRRADLKVVYAQELDREAGESESRRWSTGIWMILTCWQVARQCR